MVGLALEQFPCRVGFFVVGRIHWDREDHQHPHELIVTVVPPPDGEPVGGILRSAPRYRHSIPQPAITRNTVELGWRPQIFLIDLWPMIPSPGRYSVVLRIDGEAVAELPLDLHDSQDMTVDDEGLSEFIDGLA